MKWIFAFALAASLMVSGCIGQRGVLTEEEKAAVFNYAGPAVDRMMAGFNDENYTRFSADFGGTLRTAMTEERFMELRGETVPKVGLYMSRGSAALEKLQGFYRVTYLTDWEKESGVKLTVTFMTNDPYHSIQGLWFDSPGLRE
jgi:hypothetical protein